MNEDAELAIDMIIQDDCSQEERLRMAMRWAYADAARIVRVRPEITPCDIRCGEEGIELLNDMATAIEERAK